MRLCCYREKKYNGRRLASVLTIAYTVQFGDTTTVTYSAVEWNHNGKNNWNKRKNFQYAKQRMEKKPLFVTFNNLHPPPSYYQYRRLEKFLVQEIAAHNGVSKRPPVIGPEWIFDPVLTSEEQKLEAKYSEEMSRCNKHLVEPVIKETTSVIWNVAERFFREWNNE